MNSPPKRAEKLHLYRPWTGQEEIDAIAETFRSGWIGTGQKTRDFERRFAETVGAEEAVAVNSCTAALHLTLTAAGVGRGDTVLVPVYTFTATAEAALHAGADVHFLDVNPTTLNVDPETVEAALALNPKTKAAIPVHIAGYPCDMTALQQIADAHGLLLLDDAAHAVAAEHNGKRIGGLGGASAFSFYPTKHITSIEGGMATTNDRQLADAIRAIRYHAITRDAWTREVSQDNANAEQPAMAYDVTAQGYKCNMTDVQAAVGLAQLEKLDRQMEIRRRIARMYQDAFADCGALETPPEPDNGRHAWHLYILKLNLDRLSASRDEFAAELEALNIGTAVHYIPLHRFTHYRKRCRSARGDFPNAERLYRRVLSIPLWPGMDENDAEDAIRAVLWTAKKRRVKRIF